MKRYVGNGYYYINFFHYFSINRNEIKRKRCLKNGDCIEDKNELKLLFENSLKNDLDNYNVRWFWCLSHNSFICILKNIGYKEVCKVQITRKSNISNLFRYWKSIDCKNCLNRNFCYVKKGKLSKKYRKEYFLIFRKGTNLRNE